MSPRKPDRVRVAKTLDKAVRKLQAKEKRQDQRSGKTGKPVDSPGRHLRDGWIRGA